MQAIGSILGTAVSSGGAGAPAPEQYHAQPVQKDASGGDRPIAPGAYGTQQNPGYQRTGLSAGIDTAKTLADAMQHPAQAILNKMAGDPNQAGTFAQQHPQMMQILGGLFQ